MLKYRAVGAGLLCALGFLLSISAAEARNDFMVVGETTTSPIGHHLFCIERPGECVAEPGKTAGPVKLDPALSDTVAEINRRTNAAIKPQSDRALYGVEERWTYPEGAGDCEDYALLKRRELHAAGIAFSNLLMTVVRKRNGEGHAVLTLRTSEGDLVLDNLTVQVKSWRDTPYTFVKRQSSDDPLVWRSIDDGADMVVGSLKK